MTCSSELAIACTAAECVANRTNSGIGEPLYRSSPGELPLSPDQELLTFDPSPDFRSVLTEELFTSPRRACPCPWRSVAGNPFTDGLDR